MIWQYQFIGWTVAPDSPEQPSKDWEPYPVQALEMLAGGEGRVEKEATGSKEGFV